MIALSQLRIRKELDAAGVRPLVRMWAFPALTWLTIAFIVAVLAIMAIRPGLRLELWLSLALAAVIVAVGVVLSKRKHGPENTNGTGSENQSLQTTG